jgi:cyanate lyase
MDKVEAGRRANLAREERGLTWEAIADAISRPPVWTVAAILGQHPIPETEAGRIAKLLGLGEEAVAAFRRQPSRTADPATQTDPTIYRFHEALQVYGPAIKELIHEEFGDGIMSAINFNLTVERRADPKGDRVVVTFDGKFLAYEW